MELVDKFIDFFIDDPVILFIALIAAGFLAFKRRVKHDGTWETPSGKKESYTDMVTGGTSATSSYLIPIGHLSSRRSKFGKSAWSWAITFLVGLAIVICIYKLYILDWS